MMGMGGMAPPPDQLVRMRRAPQAVEEKKNGEDLEVKPKNESPFFRTEISMIIWSIHWQYQKKLLDIVELLCRDDKQWTTARRMAMDVQNEQVDVLRVMVNKKIQENKALEQEKSDGAGNGSDGKSVELHP